MAGEAFAELLVRQRQFEQAQILDVALVVSDHALGEPLAEAVSEESIGKVLAPERAVADAGLGERPVQVQHADQAGPGAAPVGHGQDGAAMGPEARQDVMAVLPHRFGHDHGGVRVHAAKDLDAHLLGINKAVLFLLVVGVGADDGPAFSLQGAGEGRLHLRLFRPALLVGREAQIAAGDKVSLPGFQGWWRFHITSEMKF